MSTSGALAGPFSPRDDVPQWGYIGQNRFESVADEFYHFGVVRALGGAYQYDPPFSDDEGDGAFDDYDPPFSDDEGDNAFDGLRLTTLCWRPVADSATEWDVEMPLALDQQLKFYRLSDLAKELQARHDHGKQALDADCEEVKALDSIVDDLIESIAFVHMRGHRVGLLDPGNVLYCHTGEKWQLVLPDLFFTFIGSTVEHWGNERDEFRDLWAPLQPVKAEKTSELRKDGWDPHVLELRAVARMLCWVMTGEVQPFISSPHEDPTKKAKIWSVLYRVIPADNGPARRFAEGAPITEEEERNLPANAMTTAEELLDEIRGGNRISEHFTHTYETDGRRAFPAKRAVVISGLVACVLFLVAPLLYFAFRDSPEPSTPRRSSDLDRQLPVRSPLDRILKEKMKPLVEEWNGLHPRDGVKPNQSQVEEDLPKQLKNLEEQVAVLRQLQSVRTPQNQDPALSRSEEQCLRGQVQRCWGCFRTQWDAIVLASRKMNRNKFRKFVQDFDLLFASFQELPFNEEEPEWYSEWYPQYKRTVDKCGASAP